MKADLAIYTHVLGVPGQYESVALMLSHKMDFNCCDNRDGFHKSSHIYICMYVYMYVCMYVCSSALSIKPYNIVSSTLEDITIACVTYCNVRNTSFGWIFNPYQNEFTCPQIYSVYLCKLLSLGHIGTITSRYGIEDRDIF